MRQVPTQTPVDPAHCWSLPEGRSGFLALRWISTPTKVIGACKLGFQVDVDLIPKERSQQGLELGRATPPSDTPRHCTADRRRSPDPSSCSRWEERQTCRAAGVLAASSISGKAGTRSTVIRWVDAEVSPLDLLEELAPDAEMRRQGKGYLGWCPFHDDRAPDGAGRPGTPSFYVVQDQRYGWSWRCLSTNCGQHSRPMRHSFRLLQELLATDVKGAIRAAKARWSGADGVVQHT